MNTINYLCALLFFSLSLFTLAEIRVNPSGPYEEVSGFGQSRVLNLSISHDDPVSPVVLDFVFEGKIDKDLSDVLERLNEVESDLLDLLPGRYSFRHGVSGSYISDGGSDMYDAGNFLRFGSVGASALSYSDGVVVDSPDGSVRYTTRKYDGLFVLAADYKAHDAFHITGGLGADGAGEVHSREFDPGFGYKAYVKTVSGTLDPSVNHLILVPDTPGLSATVAASTDDDGHSVSGLQADGRLYYLLFSKSSGAVYTDLEVEALASYFLMQVSPSPEWFLFPDGRTVPAGSSLNVPVTVDASGLDAGVYTTRFAVVERGTDQDTVPAESYQTMSFTVEDALFEAEHESYEVLVLDGEGVQTLDVALLPVEPGVMGSLQISSSDSWLWASRVAGENRLLLQVSASSLAFGSHVAELSVRMGSTTQTIPVKLTHAKANLVQLLPDPVRPRLYALHQSDRGHGWLLVYDSVTRRVQHKIALGLEPSDMDLTEQAADLLVINSMDPSIMRVDLSRLQVTATYPLSEYNNRNRDFGGHVEDGPGNVIYYVDEQWGPRLRVFDFSTGTVLQTFSSASGSSPDVSNNNGYGDVSVSPDGTRLFGWQQYGDSAGSSATGVIRHTINADGTLTDFELSDSYSGDTPNFRRDPMDTPILWARDGSRMVIKDRVVDQSDLDLHPMVYADEVYSISSGGEIVIGANAIYSGEAGNVMHSFAQAKQVHAMMPDDRTLVSFDSSAANLQWLDLESSLETGSLSLTPILSDGVRVIGTEQTLSWNLEPKALFYRVYLGTSRTAVMQADPDSAEFLGSVTGNEWSGALPPMNLGREYFWRVDMIGLHDSRQGDVWSFEVLPIIVESQEKVLHAPVGAPIPDQRHSMTSTGSLSWTASSTSPWISVRTRSGRTDSTLIYVINPSGLAVGTHTGAVQITAGLKTFDVPVTLHLYDLNIVKMQQGIDAGSVLALSNTNGVDVPSFLLDLNVLNGSIRRYIEVGVNATDFDVATGQKRAYCANFNQDASAVVDLESWSLLAPYQLATAPRYVEVSSEGLLILEDTRNIRTVVYDPIQQLELSRSYIASTSYGAKAVLSSDGGRYFRQGVGNGVGEYRFEEGNLVLEQSYTLKGNTSGDIFLSGDESICFMSQMAYDTQSGKNWHLPSVNYATDQRGNIGIGGTEVYWSRSGRLLHTFDSHSNMVAVSSDDQYVLRWLSSERRFESVSMASIVSLLGIRPQPGERLSEAPGSFSVPAVAGATAYRLWMGADPSSMRQVMAQSEPEFVWAGELLGHSFHFWRVDADTPGGTVLGAVHDFELVIPGTLIEGASDGAYLDFKERTLFLGDTGYGSFSLSSYDWDSNEGAFKQSSSYSKSSTLPVWAPSVASAGGHLFQSHNGGLIQYRSFSSGGWLASDTILVDDISNQVRWVRSDGDLLFVTVRDGVSGTNNCRVHIFRTAPHLVLEQTIEMPNSTEIKDFADSIAVSGNTLVLSSRYSAYPYAPKLWVYHRDSSGHWSISDAEGVSDATYSNNRLSLATDGTTIACSYFSDEGNKVALFRQQSPGRYIREASVATSAMSHGTNSILKIGLDVDQDHLVIGDYHSENEFGDVGVIFVMRRVNGVWTELPHLSLDYNVSLNGTMALADGLIAAGHTFRSELGSEASVFRLDENANRRPLITSERPSQVVAGRNWVREITVSDDDPVNVFLDQGPSWLSVRRNGAQFEFAGTVPAGGSGLVTVRIRATDSQGVSSYQTFDIDIMASDDIPQIVSVSGGGEKVQGGRVDLIPEVTGSGPFSWQWYKDGQLIEGANKPRLELSFVGTGDTGDYHYEVTNLVATSTSEVIRVDVRDATRFEGDWPMFGNGPSHLGHHPARLGSHQFVEAWSREVADRALGRTSIAEGKVFVSFENYNLSRFGVEALDLSSGSELWFSSMERGSMNPTSYHNGRVYVQRGGGWSDTALWSLDAGSGSVVWSAPHGAQFERYEAPTVTDEGIWINGGSYGGMYGFEHNGREMFYASLPQVSGWTPVEYQGRIFTWLRGTFREHDSITGRELWSMNFGNSSAVVVPVISGRYALLNSSYPLNQYELLCLDLDSKKLLWGVDASTTQAPAVFGDYVYVKKGAEIVSYRLEDGEPGRVYQCPSPMTAKQPLLWNDHMAVASDSATYIFNLGQSEPIQILPTGGELSYSQGYLLTAGKDGTLTAYFANDLPDIETQVLADATEDIVYSQTIRAVDEDPNESLTYQMLEGPAWLKLSESGVLSGTLLHTQGGLQTVRVQVTDGVTDPVVKQYQFNGIEVNEQPESTPLSLIVNEDAAEFFIPLGAYFEDEETADDDLVYELVRNDAPGLLSATLLQDGRLSMLCEANQYGVAKLTLRATDEGGLSVETTVSIRVVSVNDRPTSLPISETVDEDSPRFTLSMADFFADVEDGGSDLRYAIISHDNPGLIAAEMQAGGQLALTCQLNQFGRALLVLEATDRGGLSVRTEAEIQVRSVNDRPTARVAEMTLDEDFQPVLVSLVDQFEDVETVDRDLVYEMVHNDNPGLLRAVYAGAQSLSLSSLKDQYGTAVLRVRATDAGGLSVETSLTVTVSPVNDQPVLTDRWPDVATDRTGAARSLELASYVFDADPDDRLRYELVANSHAGIFSRVEVDGLSGTLQLEFASYVSGSSLLTLRVTDLAGTFVEQSITVTLPDLPLPAVSAGEIVMNRQTGMYSQKVTVTNLAGRDIGGFLLRVKGLQNGYRVYGVDGNLISFLSPVAPGESHTFTLEYYSEVSGLMPTPEFEVELAQPEEPETPAELGVEIKRVHVLSDRSVMLELFTQVGKRYAIQYSDDMKNWHRSEVEVSAVSNRTQWVDQGLPRTHCHPSECTSRIYRVLELSDLAH